MSRMWLPPQVSRDLRQSTEQHKMDVMRAARRDATLDYWDKELKKIDPDLYLIQAQENAQVPGLRPGYYHVIRDNPGAPATILPITGPDGEFIEPQGQLLDLLRAGDLQNRRAMEDRRRKDEQAAEAKRRQEQADHEERVDEMFGRWKSATQTSVSMNRDAPWTQNAAGRRGRKAA